MLSKMLLFSSVTNQECSFSEHFVVPDHFVLVPDRCGAIQAFLNFIDFDIFCSLPGDPLGVTRKNKMNVLFLFLLRPEL